MDIIKYILSSRNHADVHKLTRGQSSRRSKYDQIKPPKRGREKERVIYH